MKTIIIAGLATLAISAAVNGRPQATAAPQPPGQTLALSFGQTASKNGNDGPAHERSGHGADYDAGVQLLLAGDYELAVKAFQRALRRAPKNADAHFNLGNAYSGLRRWQDAVEAYQQALRYNSKDAEAYNNLALAYSELGQHGQAVTLLKQAIRIHRAWAEPYYNLSNVYYRLGQTQAAADFYKQAVSINAAYANRAALIKTNAPQDAAPASNSRVAALTGPDDGNWAERDHPTNVRANEKAVRLNQNDAKVYYNLGVKHGRAKRYDEAVKAFKQALAFKPDYADAYFGLGHAYADLGRWQEAVDAYAEVARLDPKDEEARYRLGEAYAKLHAQTGDAEPSRSGTAVGERVSEINAPPSSASSNVPAKSPEAAGAPASNEARHTEDPSVPGPVPAENELRVNKSLSAEATNAAIDPTSTYRVGVGDVLDVHLLDTPTSGSSLFTVLAGGALEYPLAGTALQIAGLTTDEIGARIAAELKRRAIQSDPKVIVGVREYVSHVVIVSGLVNEPGAKVLRREAIPLYVVLADAQPKPEAGQVVIRSKATGRETTLSLTDEAWANVLVNPGDVVNIEPSPQQFFYISGDVKMPGQKAFHPGLTLTQSILVAGGKLSGGGSVSLMRQEANGLLTKTSYKLKSIIAGKEPDPRLQPNDRIEVVP